MAGQRKFLYIFVILIMASFSYGCVQKAEILGKDAMKTVSQTSTSAKSISESSPVREITLIADDGIKLKANYMKTASPKAVALFPILGSGKESYDDFAASLAKEYAVLAIDPRGHGDSDLDWKDFSEADFRKMVLDVKAAKEFLGDEGYAEIILVGASIGANNVLNYAASDSSISRIVLLSPGLDYKGVSTEDSIKTYSNRMLIVASSEDKYSFESSQKLFDGSKADKKFIKLDNAGHGTDMLKDADLVDEIIGWMGS